MLIAGFIFVVLFIHGIKSNSVVDFDPLSLAQFSSNIGNVTFNIPYNFTDPNALLNRTNYVKAQLDLLVQNLNSLLNQFSESNGPEIVELQGFMNDINVLNNNISVFYDQLINITEENNPIPCTNPNYNVTDGQNGTLPYPGYSTFNCSWAFRAPNGVIIQINIQNFDFWSGNARNNNSITIVDSKDTIYVLNTTTTSYTGNFSNNVNVYLIGALTFTLNYKGISVCDGFNCGYGNCSAGPNNSPKCTCDNTYPNCYAVDPNSGKCTIYENDCDPNNGVAGKLCAHYSNNCTCYLQSNCAGACLKKSDNTSCFDFDMIEKHEMLRDYHPNWWSVHENDEKLEENIKIDESEEEEEHEHGFDFDFDPIQIVAKAHEEAQNIRIPIKIGGEKAFLPTDVVIPIDFSIPPEDPNKLINRANYLSNELKGFLTTLTGLVAKFNVTTGGAEQLNDYLIKFQALQTRASAATKNLQDLESRTEQYKTRLSYYDSILTCMANSNCIQTTTTVTTTTTTAPPFVCDTPNPKPLYLGVNNSTYIAGTNIYNNYPNCSWFIYTDIGKKIPATINLIDNNYGGNLILKDNLGLTYSSSVNLTNTTTWPQIVPFTGYNLTLTATGTLQFNISFTTVSVCDGVACGNGTCYVSNITNQPQCKCFPCFYQNIGSSYCDNFTDPCSNAQAQNTCNAGVNGNTCVDLINSTYCSWACKCGGNSGITSYCDFKENFWQRYFGHYFW